MKEKQRGEYRLDQPESGMPPPSVESSADFLASFSVRLGGHALRYLPALLVPSALGFVGVAIFTRIFAPEPYGWYSLAMAATAIAISVFGGWLEQSTLRYLPRYREQKRLAAFTARLSAVLIIAVIGFVALASAMYMGGRSFLGVYQNLYFPCVALVVSSVIYTIYGAAFVANLQPTAYARYQIVQSAGKVLFALLYVGLISPDVVGLVIGAVAAHAVLLPFMFRELRIVGSIRATSRLLDGEFAKSIFLYGFPLVGQNVAKWLLSLSNRFVIGIFRGPEEVGIYSANYNLAATVIAFLAGPILFAAHPLIFKAWEGGDRTQIRGVIATCSRYFLLLTLPIGVYVGIFSKQITSVLFGEAFREGFPVVPLVVFGMILFQFGFYGHKGIKLLERTGILFAMVLICALVNVGLNLALVPSYGYIGAAVATAISYALYPVMVHWTTRKMLPWLIPWRSIRNIGISVLVSGLFWWMLRTDLTSGVDWMVFGGVTIAGFLIYAAALYLLGELQDYEKKFLIGRVSAIFGRRR